MTDPAQAAEASLHVQRLLGEIDTQRRILDAAGPPPKLNILVTNPDAIEQLDATACMLAQICQLCNEIGDLTWADLIASRLASVLAAQELADRRRKLITLAAEVERWIIQQDIRG